MTRNFEVQDFSKKLNLLLRSGKAPASTVAALSNKFDFITLDYLQRQISGTRPLSERVFLAIVEFAKTAGLNQADWFEPVDVFGRKLGLSAAAISQITGVVTSGIDFKSRSNDPDNLRSVHRLIGGYWESFYYSVSTFGKQRISHDLVVIDPPDHQGLMPCRVIDGSFTYEGHCFPIHGSFLYLMLEKVPEYDEIIVYMVNRPERSKGTELDGVILCTSGGVDDKVAVPCAARVAFRFLGSTQEDVLEAYPLIKVDQGESFEASVRKALFSPRGYIESASIRKSNSRLWAVKRIIDNTIRPDQIPFAMRMERSLPADPHKRPVRLASKKKASSPLGGTIAETRPRRTK
jgi:hypothetical protein